MRGDGQGVPSKSSVSGVWQLQLSLYCLLAEQDLLVASLQMGGVTPHEREMGNLLFRPLQAGALGRHHTAHLKVEEVLSAK